jgi:iron-sulfur cluster repair protein YtfE (RIC family)
MTATTEKTVREIAAECPASVRVFETLGIDYCCGGRKSLRDACMTADVPRILWRSIIVMCVRKFRGLRRC